MASADVYASKHSRIFIDWELSLQIKEGQCIRQGAETFTRIFNARGTKALDTLSTLPDLLCVRYIKVGAPTCADDTCLLSSALMPAQTVFLVALDDANRE